MSAAHVPAARLEIPRQFGRRPDAAFLETQGTEGQALACAARIQHHAAVVTLDALQRQGRTLAWLASQVGEHPDHLRRKLHGQVPASILDLCRWEASTGARTLPSPDQPGGRP